MSLEDVGSLDDTYLPIFVVYDLLETIEMSLSCCCSVIKRQTEEDCYNFQFIGNTMLVFVAGLTLADRPVVAGDPTHPTPHPPSIVLRQAIYCGTEETQAEDNITGMKLLWPR